MHLEVFQHGTQAAQHENHESDSKSKGQAFRDLGEISFANCVTSTLAETLSLIRWFPVLVGPETLPELCTCGQRRPHDQ